MTGLETLLYTVVTAGIAIVALWLLYRTWVFGQRFEWDANRRFEVWLVRCGRAGVYLFLVSVVLTFGALTSMLAMNNRAAGFALLAMCSGIASCSGIIISLVCSLLVRSVRRSR